MRRIPIPYPLDLELTLYPLARGHGDPTMLLSPAEVWRACNTPDGPATLHARVDRGDASATARAWGPGSDWALDCADALIGARDDPHAFRTDDPVVAGAVARLPGLRLGAATAVCDVAIGAVIDQRVTGMEAGRTWRQLVYRHGGVAPHAGRDAPESLRIAPPPEVVAALDDRERRALGLESRRGAALCRVADDASGLQRAAALGSDVLGRRLSAMPGVGDWTASRVQHAVLGDPDAVMVGDWHMPRVVSYAFTGRVVDRTEGDDTMLELLEPFRGQRARVVRLLLAAGLGPARRAPRAEIPDLLARERRGRPYSVRRTLRFEN